MSTSQARISVIIPTYNRAAYLAASLRSVLQQTLPPYQVIVVDDGSTDGTAEVVAGFAGRVEYLHKPNGGKASALNLALAEVRGDYLWIFDDDDIAAPDANERRMQVFAENPQVGLVYGDHSWAREDAHGDLVPERVVAVPDLRGRAAFQRLLRYCYFIMPGMLVRSECVRRAGPLREELIRSQDYEYMLRLARLCEAAHCPHQMLRIRMHAGERGTAAQSHAASAKRRVWLEYDGIIGARLRAELELHDYLPQAVDDMDAAARRRALLYRAEVMASKGLVDAMFEDLQSACATRDGALGPAEAKACRAALNYPYLWMALPSLRTLWPRLRGLADSVPGRAVLVAWVRSAYWTAGKRMEGRAPRTRLWSFAAACLLAAYLPGRRL